MTSRVLVYFFLCLSVEYVSPRIVFDYDPTSKCVYPRGEKCIEIRKCPFFEDLLSKSPIPRTRNVIKLIRENQCGFINNTPYVCCHQSTLTPEIDRIDKEDSTEDSMYIEDKFTSSVVTKHKNYNLLRNDICGRILPVSPTAFRITSGKKTSLDEFPWMALIAYNTNHDVDFRCGGTVINERYVLTAAHCILNSTIFGVRLGEYDLDTVEDCDPEQNYCAPPTQDFYIQDVKVHPDYDPKTFINDIALIRLATPANFSVSNVKPICLPCSETDDLNGKSAVVSGWGVTESGFKSPKLMKASIPVLPTSACQWSYKQFAPITSKQICAGGYKGKDTCGGDSGGPLKYVGIINGTPRFIQYGIVSYGPRHCGASGQPGIYTRVSGYVRWILDNLKPNEDE